MKKLLIACFMFAGMQMVSAQEATWIPKNVALGVGVGTTGIVIDASTTVHNYFGVRFGVDIMPKFKYSGNLNLGIDANKSIQNLKTEYASYLGNIDVPNKVEVEGKLNNTTWHFLIDVYPFGSRSSFHATVGAYFGSKKIINIYNKEQGLLDPVNQWNEAVRGNNLGVENMAGVELGDYFITPNPDDKGNVTGKIEVASFRPYLGVGFGRAVPKNRIGCQFDLGVQFWGTPDVIAPMYNKSAYPDKDGYTEGKLDKASVSGDDGGFIKTLSKIKVYPVLNFRLVGRIL